MKSSQIQSRNDNTGTERARSASRGARPWYKRALGGLQLWRQPAAGDAAPGKRPPTWCSSLKAAASAVARVACLCEPLCSTDRSRGVQADAMAPRRRRTMTPIGPTPRAILPAGEWGDAPWISYRRRTLNEELLMRQYILDEKAACRRMGLEVAPKWYGRTWLPPPPSRLSLMSLADDGDNAEEEAGGSGSSSFRCSEVQPL